jgi:hypothetical protein
MASAIWSTSIDMLFPCRVDACVTGAPRPSLHISRPIDRSSKFLRHVTALYPSQERWSLPASAGGTVSPKEATHSSSSFTIRADNQCVSLPSFMLLMSTSRSRRAPPHVCNCQPSSLFYKPSQFDNTLCASTTNQPSSFSVRGKGNACLPQVPLGACHRT